VGYVTEYNDPRCLVHDCNGRGKRNVGCHEISFVEDGLLGLASTPTSSKQVRKTEQTNSRQTMQRFVTGTLVGP
jgi:hypothetical protein